MSVPTTRQRIFSLTQHLRTEDEELLASLLNLDPADVAATLASPSHVPTDPAGGAGAKLVWTPFAPGDFLNGCHDYGEAGNPARWAKDANFGYLAGIVGGMSLFVDSIQLPPAVKPSGYRRLVHNDAGGQALLIDATGKVSFHGPGGGSDAAIDGVFFALAYP